MQGKTTTRLFLMFVLAFMGLSLAAQIPSGYYNNANGKTGDELKVALHNIIKGHHVVYYGDLLDAFVYTDCKPNGKIWDIYSNIEYSPSSNICGNYEHEGDCWNREHTWPQSWFNESTTPRSDLFHVYPTDGFVNGQRSNYPYGEVNNPTYTSGNGSKLGPCVTAGYSGKVFEPIDEYKGDIARSYFYMSVRYYSEDSDWGSSGMTNKSEIKDWAMTMLLRWSDEDPVSDKEIARNNAVYGYQNNRNPFIDHPEYARMIWDPNWQGGVPYNITCATGLSHGSVSAPESAIEGSTVSITATPDLGYMVDTYTVYKTGSPNTTVAVSSNGTFTMPGYAVTVSVTFVQNNNDYDITLGTVSHGSISANKTSAKSGTTINLTATPNMGYSLYSWYVFKTGDMSTTVLVSGNSFVMPAFNVTVMATFVQGNTGNYVKVTSAPADWSGEYLIVCESQGVAFNGVVESNWGRCSNVTITNNTIASTTTVEGYKVTISQKDSGYRFQLPSGNYMSWTSRDFKENQTGIVYSISLDNNSVSIVYNGYTLQYNHNSGSGGLRSYTSNQTAIQLYKKTVNTQTHTIQFNNNGGTGTMNDQTVNEFEPTALDGNVFVREGFVFDGWNTEADGTGDYYADGATVTLLDDLTLYAQWEQLYTVTLAAVENGSISASPMEAVEEATITLTATPAPTYELDHWTVIDANNHPITVTENQFEMPASDVTVSATFVYVGEPFAQKYYLVTSTNQLVAGRTYLIVNTSAGKALGTTQNTNNRSGVSVTINNNVIASINNTVCELTLGGQSGAWTLFDAKYDNNTGGYLYAASNSKNYLRTQATNDTNGQWTVTIASSGSATITANGANSHNIIRYNPNSGNPIFSCYDSGQQDVCLFIRSEEYDHTESETIANLFAFDKHTVRSGATLTVSGTATCDDASHLILEDGAQLVHHNDGVKATVKKYIIGYVGDEGWYTIASPITNFAPNGTNLIDADFDLYAYHESDDLEWYNYKAHQDGFVMASGSGYLYAHNPDITLRMSGTLNNGNYSNIVNLSYGNSEENLKGFNLLGNPTAHDINYSKTDAVSNGYYYIENGSTWTYTPSTSVPAGRGFLVKANTENQTVTLNPSRSKGYNEDEGQYLCLSVGDEKTYVKLDEGVSMPLLDLKGQRSSLYFTSAGKAYVMLVRDGAEALDLSFEARRNRTTTLKVDAQGLGLEYLHLIDHLTGADIDLLETPSYSFNADMTDYASRFRLVFNAGSETDGPSTGSGTVGTFAFISNGEIRLLVETCHGASLQVVDMMGRVIRCTDGVHTVSTNGMAPGVYVLRLINDDEVKVQKIVIK